VLAPIKQLNGDRQLFKILR